MGGQPPKQPPAKKIYEDPNMAGVREAVGKASNITDAVKQMLLACLATSLGVPSAERHETQASVVSMIREVIGGVTSQLQDAVADEKAKVSDAECHKEQLEAALGQAEEAQCQADEVVLAKDTALADAATAVTVAKEALFECQEAQKNKDGALVQAKQRETEIQKALAEDLPAIIDGTSASYQGVLDLLQDVSLDASLTSALPKTCSKAVSERSQFDTMVLDQLRSILVGKENELAKLITDAGPAAAERIAAIEAAQSDLDSATAASRKAAEELAETKRAAAQAKAAVQEAQRALREYEPRFAEATKERDQRASDLENWTDYNVACFELLAA